MAMLSVDQRTWFIPIVVLVLTWAVSAFTGFTNRDSVLTNRVTAVETQQKIDSTNMKDRLDRIEVKIDRFFYEVTGKKP